MADLTRVYEWSMLEKIPNFEQLWKTFASVNFENLKTRIKFRPSIFTGYNGIVMAQMESIKKEFF